jgi:protein ImuB
MRLACLRVPDFPLQALRRSCPDLADAPVAVAAGPQPRDEIVAVSAEAAALGARPGVTASQARTLAPGVLVRTVPPEVAAAASEALADVAGGVSPRVKRGRPGEVLLDIGGLLPRFGSEGAVAGHLLRACRRVGLEARVGIAGGAGVARVAGRCGDDVVVAEGGEGAFLAPLPLELLEPPEAPAAALERWGIRTAGELARLPRPEVALRLGPEGVALHRLAAGEEDEAFVPDPAREALREGIDLEHPVATLEPFLFVLRGLLARLADRLEVRGEGFAELLLEMHLEGGERGALRVKLVAPTREVPAALALARLQLEAHPPGGPVESVAVLATPGRVRLAQGELFGPPRPAPGRLAMTLARLAALVGPDRAGSPAVPDTHRPGAWAIVPFVLHESRERLPVARSPLSAKTAPDSAPVRSSSFTDDGQRTTDTCLLPPILRAFRPPIEARVGMAGARPLSARAGDAGGVVLAWAGPYRFVGDWWTEEPFARDDYDVATADGSLLRVFFDRLAGRWFAEGRYD